MRDALCREHHELSWFPHSGGTPPAVIAVCRACLVRGECLTAALDATSSASGAG
jgi:hypothetical protein